MKTSSSRTELWICTDVSSERNLETWHGVRGIPRLRARRGVVHFVVGDGIGRMRWEGEMEKKVGSGWSCEADGRRVDIMTRG
jgi:hypothetical protein